MDGNHFLNSGGMDDEAAFLLDTFELLLQVERADVVTYPTYARHGNRTPFGGFRIGCIPDLIRLKGHA